MMIDVKLKLEEKQRVLLGILKYFHNVCEENNLTYYLAYGTLIGAIRHKGFIPWDDDVDVMMPRRDFYKLVDIFNQNQNSNYKLVSSKNVMNFTSPLAKIIDTRTYLEQHYDYLEKVPLGLYLDIFILDGAGNTYDESVKKYYRSFEYYKNWRKSVITLFPPNKSKIYGVLRYIKNIKYILKGYRYYLKEMEKYNSEIDYYNSEYVSTFEVGTLEASKCIWPRSSFEPKIKTQFEGMNLYIPNDYNLILQSEYGDYMTLPPKELQISNHLYSLKIDEKYYNDLIKTKS